MASLGSTTGLAFDVTAFEGLTVQQDTTPADWFAAASTLGAFGTVGALVPAGFDACARIDYNGDSDPLERRALLFDVLSRHTATPADVWFGLWDGYGGLDLIPPEIGRIRLPAREYLLFRGDIGAWRGLTPHPMRRVPDLIWPDDRAWFVGTDTDLDDGYVGAAPACVAALEEAGLVLGSATRTDRL